MAKIKIGHHLEAARKAVHLTVEDAAEKLGIVRGTLGRYEKDQRLPDAEVLVDMSRLYKCGVDVLLGTTEPAVVSRPIPIAGEVIDAEHFKFDETGPYKKALPIWDNKDVFALEVVSNSLTGIANTGEYLIIQREPAAEKLSINLAADISRQQNIGKIIGVYRRPRGT